MVVLLYRQVNVVGGMLRASAARQGALVLVYYRQKEQAEFCLLKAVARFVVGYIALMRKLGALGRN
jgi:hypothetical protein